ncbi:hypothetical protein [Lacipirellula sp.]|uniref:hypothetical protein n=1 Tax=Lacipirellula sp. TaxID=2691419 RepID=UPI003D108D58
MTDTELLAEQQRISARLHRGVIFSNVWLCGIGSLYSLIIGIDALRAIRRADGMLYGKWRAWWCVSVGGLGSLFLVWFALTLTLHMCGIRIR